MSSMSKDKISTRKTNSPPVPTLPLLSFDFRETAEGHLLTQLSLLYIH